MWSQEIACEYVRGLVGFMDSFNGGFVWLLRVLLPTLLLLS